MVSSLDYIARPHLKNQKRAGGVAPVVKCPPGEHKALSSNPNTSKKREKFS
jgi:hypothetical protein